MNEVLDAVRFLKGDINSLKENVASIKEDMVTKKDLEASLAATEERLEKNILFGVAEFMEQNVLPQFDSMHKEISGLRRDMDIMGVRIDTMGTDIQLIKKVLTVHPARY